MRLYAFAVLAASLIIAPVVHAEAPHHPPFTDVVVQTFDNQTLAVTTDKGARMSVTVPVALRPMVSTRVTAATLRVGQFIHSTTVAGEGGKLVAQDIHILPEEMRGAVEGHLPAADAGLTLTNGTIAKVIARRAERTMIVTYKGGRSEVRIPRNAEVTTLAFGDMKSLKPGAKLKLLAQEAPSGTWTAQYVTVIR